MNIQRIRNLTTGRLHTAMDHIYIDLEKLTGVRGIMTHMIPNVATAIEPYLRGKLVDSRLWDGKYDQSHQGDIDIEPMNKSEKEDFWKRYSVLRSPLESMENIPTPTKCKSDMIDPVIRKICDKLEALDFELLHDKHSVKIRFCNKLDGNTTSVFVEADADSIGVHISGLLYDRFNEESFNLLLKVFNDSVYKKKENIKAIDNARNKRIMDSSIKNILNAAL